MIYKGVKYACATCIKGHRSSNCNHVERPLFEIRKKGRPVTQCSFCRDLRKTKQVHIKCACTHKSSKEQQPILIYQSEEASLGKCTCSDLNHDHNITTTTTTTANILTPYQQDDASPSPPSSSSCSSTVAGGLLSHASNTATMSNMLMDNSFSWAVVTPSQEPLYVNEDPVNLGFIFHKPSSQRFLEGQPRPPRKKSVRKPSVVKSQGKPTSSSSPSSPSSTSSPSHSTTTANSTASTQQLHQQQIQQQQIQQQQQQQQQQQEFMLPLMELDIPSSSSSCSDNGGLSSDLTLILNNVLKPLQEQQEQQQQFKMEEEMMNQELANLELTQTTNGLMYPTSSSTTNSTTIPSTCSSTPGTPPHHHQHQHQQHHAHHQQGSTSSSPTSSSSFYPMATQTPSPDRPAPPSSSSSATAAASSSSSSSNGFDQVGCCNAFSSHMCRAADQPGESVVITIAPLSATYPLQSVGQVRTRIVTCYCGNQCTCPGCLVHPGNFLVGDPMMDPYRGLSGSTCPSSTASSIYSASDDEDQQQSHRLL